MDYKSFFNSALSEAFDKYTFSDADEMMKSIRERAMNMENKTEKRHNIFNAVAGTAATVAVIGGSVLGLNYLNEHGGLKEGGYEGGGAGYHEDMTDSAYTEPLPLNNETPVTLSVTDPVFTDPLPLKNETPVTLSVTDPTELPDIGEAIGEQLEFHDASVRLTHFEYDGENLMAVFSVLTDKPDYSPDYIKPNVGYTIKDGEVINCPEDEFNYDFTVYDSPVDSLPESGGFNYICSYSVPLQLEPGCTYWVSIDYLNTEGESSQPVETAEQKYSFCYNIYVKTETEAANIAIGDYIKFSDCTVNVSGIERYGNTIKLTLDAYAEENCDLQYISFIIDETGERAENKNRIPWHKFFDWSDWTEVNADHLQITFVLQPYLPEGTERIFLLEKGNVTKYDTEETAYFTITGADTSEAYVREVNAVGTGLTGEEMPIDRIEIDPFSISFDVIGSFAFETEFSVKFKDGRVYTYNKDALVRNGRTWEDQDGNTVCSTEFDSVHLAEDGDYFDEKNTGKMRYFIFVEDPIFDVNEIESITILGAEIPITAE